MTFPTTGKLLEDFLVPIDTWGNFDFLGSLKSGEIINTKVIDILRKAERKTRPKRKKAIDD